jgi:hypothetical protein
VTDDECGSHGSRRLPPDFTVVRAFAGMTIEE